MIAIPKRRVFQGLLVPRCVVRISENAEQQLRISENAEQQLQISENAQQQLRISENALQKIRVSFMSCDCVQNIAPCIAQNADKIFQFADSDTVNYGSATEITFDIWQGNISGTSLFSVSLTGGEITLPSPNVFQLEIDNTDSGAFPAGRHYCEAWVTLPGNDRRMVGAGSFTVIDTRKFD